MSTLPSSSNTTIPTVLDASLPTTSLSSPVLPTSSSSAMTDSSVAAGKRRRDADDEGDQDLHRDNDIDMNNLVISECLANEDFPVELVPGLETIAP